MNWSRAVIRFAGDSGDGMQLTGSQFTPATALAGNDLATFPDFPAEIRAPAGTTFGVSAFQINFGSRVIKTAGDELDVLVAMNPAALKVNLRDLKPGGLVVVDDVEFNDKNLRKAGYAANPLEDGTLGKLPRARGRHLPAHPRGGQGLRPRQQGVAALQEHVGARPGLLAVRPRPRADRPMARTRSSASGPRSPAANIAALNAGHAFGETAEMPSERRRGHRAARRTSRPGVYRTVTGTEALAWGLVAGAKLAGPADDLRRLSDHAGLGAPAHPGAAEATSASRPSRPRTRSPPCAPPIGASYAGALGVTSSSGPGIALKTEAIGLAIATELPLVIVNSQRGGPSTGLPTKTEQSDLYQAVYGRNADSPLVGDRLALAGRLLRGRHRGGAAGDQIHDPGHAC